MNKTYAIIQDDPWLEPYLWPINERFNRFTNVLNTINEHWGSLDSFASAYKHMGIFYDESQNVWVYREWAPMANALYLFGDFNQWNRQSHPLTKNDNGVWELIIKPETLVNGTMHGSLVKVCVHSQIGVHDRIPAYIRRVVQDEETKDFSGQVWWPSQAFQFKNEFDPSKVDSLIIYECHVGMSQEKEGVGTFKEFTETVLPRAKALGYTAIQLMAIPEHPYYGSYGYHVSNLFAPSSRFGTPEDLKELIDTAHGLGLAVIMDIVHSHHVKNFNEGLNFFDGTEWQYFHSGGKGTHDLWDSKLYNYGKMEVMQFLLSNVKYWLDEFKFDGYRFDGVTSMMYLHHGNLMSFDHYDKYFYHLIDDEAITYLQLANRLIHTIKPGAVSIAEDVSGMPGLCRTIDEGGIEFDYRLGMGIPDYWIKLLKERNDEDWDIYELWSMLVNRRWRERTIAYAESHDQALVGDKTLAFWLMDKEMYWHMQIDDPNIIIDRGIALHKLIRAITISLGGHAYLTFFGNEFGHPEWIDFPSERNNWSYKYAQRKWSLAQHPKLKYQYLENWDVELLKTIRENNILQAEILNQLNMDPNNKVIIFEKNRLVFIFNFHPNNSIFDYRFNVPFGGTYRIIANSDQKRFGGFDRIDMNTEYRTTPDNQLSVYITSRTCLVLKLVE